jgi:outer membrane protein assembly factor BamB
MAFKQVDVDTMPVPLVYQDGLLVGPAGLTELICYNVRTGQAAWQLSADDEIRWIFKPGGDYVGFSTQGGGVALVDVYEGRIEMVTGVPQALGGYASGVMHKDSLLVMAVQRTNAGDGASLVSLDVATGDVRWQRDDLPHVGADRYALWRLLTLADDVVPLFVRLDATGKGELESMRGGIGIELVDKATGKTHGPVVDTGRSNTDAQKLTGEYGLWPDRMILDSRNGLISIGVIAESVGDHDLDGKVSSGIEP